MTEPTTHTLEVPGATLTYDVHEPEAPSEQAPAVHLRLADGRLGLRAARGSLHGPHGHHLRPAWHGAEHP